MKSTVVTVKQFIWVNLNGPKKNKIAKHCCEADHNFS